MLAVVQVGGPLLLIALGEREISSSLTGILVATAPIFTFLLAFALEGEERASRLEPGGRGDRHRRRGDAARAWTRAAARAALVGGLMVVLASFGYGVGALVRQAARARRPADRDGRRDHRGYGRRGDDSCSRPLSAPAHAPSLGGRASLVALGVLCTGARVRDLLLAGFDSDGPAKASLVGYIAPGFSIVYGVTLLDESFTVRHLRRPRPDPG